MGCALTLLDVSVSPTGIKLPILPVLLPASINTSGFSHPSSAVAVLPNCVAPRQMRQCKALCLGATLAAAGGARARVCVCVCVRACAHVEGAECGGTLDSQFYEVLVSCTMSYSAVELATFSSRQSWRKVSISWLPQLKRCRGLQLSAPRTKLCCYCVLKSWENSTTVIICISRNSFWF